MYKTTLKNNKVNFEKQIWSNLDKFQQSNPKEYWTLLSKLRGLDENYKQNPIPMDEWVKHFTTLLNEAIRPDPNLTKEIDSYIDIYREKIFN